MKPFTSLTSASVALLRDNIDTDAIIPSREIRAVAKTGLAAGLFAAWRYTDADVRTPDPGFALNQPGAAQAQILLGGANFGCGSSREHAVWALLEFGFRVIIAPDFAPIFYDNCIGNGLLPVILPAHAIAQLVGAVLTIDLAQQRVQARAQSPWHFDIAAAPKAMLLGGLDAIALSLQHEAALQDYRARDAQRRPWVYLGAAP